jgi:aspartate/glutamate racemase
VGRAGSRTAGAAGEICTDADLHFDEGDAAVTGFDSTRILCSNVVDTALV